MHESQTKQMVRDFTIIGKDPINLQTLGLKTLDKAIDKQSADGACKYYKDASGDYIKFSMQDSKNIDSAGQFINQLMRLYILFPEYRQSLTEHGLSILLGDFKDEEGAAQKISYIVESERSVGRSYAQILDAFIREDKSAYLTEGFLVNYKDDSDLLLEILKQDIIGMDVILRAIGVENVMILRELILGLFCVEKIEENDCTRYNNFMYKELADFKGSSLGELLGQHLRYAINNGTMQHVDVIWNFEVSMSVELDNALQDGKALEDMRKKVKAAGAFKWDYLKREYEIFRKMYLSDWDSNEKTLDKQVKAYKAMEEIFTYRSDNEEEVEFLDSAIAVALGFYNYCTDKQKELIAQLKYKGNSTEDGVKDEQISGRELDKICGYAVNKESLISLDKFSRNKPLEEDGSLEDNLGNLFNSLLKGYEPSAGTRGLFLHDLKIVIDSNFDSWESEQYKVGKCIRQYFKNESLADTEVEGIIEFLKLDIVLDNKEKEPLTYTKLQESVYRVTSNIKVDYQKIAKPEEGQEDYCYSLFASPQNSLSSHQDEILDRSYDMQYEEDNVQSDSHIEILES